MHQFGGTDDGIQRTGLNTNRAADARAFIDDRDCARSRFLTEGWIERQRRALEQTGQGGNGFTAARRALIDGCLPLCNGFSIRLAAVIGATLALGLRQQGINLFDQIHRFILESIAGVYREIFGVIASVNIRSGLFAHADGFRPVPRPDFAAHR